jgi:DNA-binding HxlR family transcriptional regulator
MNQREGAQAMSKHVTTNDLARLLKVIADDTRLRILGLLAERTLVGKEIATALDLSPPTVTHHMRKLVDAGIVAASRDAQMQRYSLNTDLLRDVRKTSIDAPETAVDTNADLSEDDALRAKVLRNFFEGERLLTIPARRKQRVIVLQHLLMRFNPARAYTELEVNDLLRPAHDDVASLRRELVDYGYMTRERGVYRVSRSPPTRSRLVSQEITGDERAWLRGIIRAAADLSASERRSQTNP